MSCSACCGGFADDEDYLRCMVELCDKTYHIPCAGGKHLTDEDRKTWVCPECGSAMKRGGDNSLTPVGLAKKHRDPNVTFRKKIPPKNNEIQKSDDSNALSTEIQNLRSEMSLLRDQLTHAVSLIASYETKLDTFALQVVSLNTKLEGYENKVLDINLVTPSLPSSLNPPSLKKPAEFTKQSRHGNHKKQQERVGVIDSTLRDVPASIALKGAATTMEVGHNERSESARLHVTEIVGCSGLTTPADQQWTEVKRRKSRGPTSLCGTAGPAITTLKAVEPVKHLHLWNMASNADDILQYIKQLCPTGTCTVEELTPKGNYKSYKIGVPEAHYEACYSIDVWPVNARIKAWINYRKPSGPAKLGLAAAGMTTTSNRQPFRCASGTQ